MGFFFFFCFCYPLYFIYIWFFLKKNQFPMPLLWLLDQIFGATESFPFSTPKPFKLSLKQGYCCPNPVFFFMVFPFKYDFFKLNKIPIKFFFLYSLYFLFFFSLFLILYFFFFYSFSFVNTRKQKISLKRRKKSFEKIIDNLYKRNICLSKSR